MSPVSRGRRPKKGRKAKLTKRGPTPPRTPAPAMPGPPREPEWFVGAVARVLDGADALLKTHTARELDDAVACLIGGEMYTALQTGWGLRYGWWLHELVDAIVARTEQTPGPECDAAVWLLHGLGAQVPNLPDDMLTDARDRATQPVPAWVVGLPDITATGRVERLTDPFGTRFGVIAEFGYPGDTDRHWYLFDVDASGFVVLADAGTFDDARDAASTWRARAAAPGAVAEPVTAPEALACLVHLDTGNEMMIRGDEPRPVMDNWFRLHVRISALAEKLRELGTPLPPETSLYRELDSDVLITPFTEWYRREHDGADLDPDVVEALVEEWMEGALPETWFAPSPGRIRFLRGLIEDWIADSSVTIGVTALLPEWARWLADRAGLNEAHRAQLTDAAAAQ